MTSRVQQGGFQDWAELRNHLIDAYGSTPHPTTEQEIIDAYELHPDVVTKAGLDLIETIGVTSPWGVLKARATKIATPPSNPTRNTSLSREKTILHAEQWVRAAGIHYDRDSEIMLELFAPSGLLGAYTHVELVPDPTDAGKWMLSEPTGDPSLVDRMLKLYNEFRPKGITIEEDALARAEKYKQQKRELAAALAKAQDELAAQQATAPNDDIPF